MSRHLKADEIVFKHDFFRTRKFAGLTFAEIGMLVCGVAHSHREENDGFLAGHLLGELGGVDGLGLDDGALTGLYVPASHDALARRLVRSGLFHEVPGGFQIHDYGDYQETTLSRQMRRVRNAQRQRKRRSPECHTHVTRDTGVTDTHPSSARASDPGFKPLSTISGSDHSVGADESKNLLRTADYGPDLERLRQIAADLRGADPKTPIVLGSVLRGQPEAVLAAALERVEARRRKTHLGPIANEAKYLVATVREVIAERGSAAA